MDTRSRSPPPTSRNGDDNWSARDDMGRDAYRRRSPALVDRRPRNDRRRSRSPLAIDRYQPGRPSRDDHSYRRRSPPPNPGNIDRYVPGQESPALVVNPLPNPLTLDYQVGFNWFAEWWRKDQEVKEERERQKKGERRQPERLKGERETREEREKERAQIQIAYDGYKEKLQLQMSKVFVLQHKGEEWFKERYDPEVRDPWRKRLAEYRQNVYRQWQSEVDSGVFDEFTLEGIYKSESNGAGGIVEKEEGEASAATEVLGVGDLVPSKGGDLRDEAALQPALLIKTIAPTVSREKMEAFCKEHIGDGEGGFRFLSLSDPNPLKKCHRIGWVMLNPGGDQEIQVTRDGRGDGRDGESDDGEERMDQTVTETVTQSAADKALNEINGKTIEDETRGNFTCHVGIHVPPTMPRKKALWDLFSAPERIERDLQLAMRLAAKLEQELGEDFNGVSKIEERVEQIRGNGGLQPPPTASGSRPAKGVGEDGEDDADADMEEGEEEDEEGAYDEEVDDEDLLAKKKSLDLLVEYLRRVFNFCFFCVFESDSIHELTRKCPGGHLRRPRASLTSAAKAAAKASAYGEPFPLKKQESVDDAESEESPVHEKRFNKSSKTQHQLQRAFNWVKTFEDKLFQILEPEAVDIKKLGGRPLEEALEDELKKFVKAEEESRFRCKVPVDNCTKLFKGENFWRKHVEKRHSEWFEKLKNDLNLVNTYVLDPAHITPSRSDSNSNGHFQGSNSMPTGTPRGFNLANLPFGMPAGFGGLPNLPGFPNTFGNYPVAAPQNWGNNGNNIMPGERLQGGPMRRSGGRFNNRSNGPYDRPPRDARNARWGGAGRLTPPRGGGRGPRYDDVGAAGIAPREAVAGRSLKSYEDLDAVEATGNDELNY